jgi:hypothetical protein
MAASCIPAGLSAPRAFGQEAGAAGSGIRAIDAVDNSIGAAFDEAHFNYGELNQGGAYVPGEGKYLDSESGYLGGGKVTASYLGEVGDYIRNFYSNVTFDIVSGRPYYNGHTFAGQPISMPTKATIDNLAVEIGAGFEAGKSAMITPYVAGGYHEWIRGSNDPATGDYMETYRNGFLGAGAMLQYAIGSRLVATAQGSFSETLWPSMDSAFDETFDSSFCQANPGYCQVDSFRLGSRPLEMAGLDLDYRLTGALHFFAGADYSHFSYGESPVVNDPIEGGLLEPHSLTDLLIWSSGLRWSFGR